ncbi:MAG: hypothetical protein IJW30_06255 [Clostridia bacterium]|nr:hypothetical protein [Clostridia bacterium]MBQ9774249.1 hypothetical protein [Clostridia bacterium]
MNTVKFEKKQVKVVAHRGVSKLERENTYAAFVAAGNRSYFGVETDVRCTRDGHFIILHDENALRVAGVEIRPEESTLEELRAIRLYDLPMADGTACETRCPHLVLPTLEEYISVCKKYEKECVLELKTEMDAATTRNMIDRITAQGYLEHVIFISFLWNDLVHVRTLLPNQKCQFLFGERMQSDELFAKMKEYRFDVDVHYQALTEEWVKKYHDAGMEINAWTVDDPADGERLASWGVDYVTSNILE